MVIALAFVGVLGSAAILIVIGLRALGISGVAATDKASAATIFDLLKVVFATIAGSGGIVALVVAYRRQRVAEASNRLAEFSSTLENRKEDRERTRLLNERFATASAQLGDENAAVRLAGVYAMAGLADDWPAQRQTCIDVLCAYLRMPYPTKPPEDAKEALSWAHDREVRHTVIRVIAAHLRSTTSTWQGHDFDFTGVAFDGGDFTGAIFSGGRVRIGYSTFSAGRVDFRGAIFSGAVVHFGFAKFTGGLVDFRGAKFTDGRVDFGLAEIINGKLLFGREELDGAEISGGHLFFGDALLQGGEVDFTHAEFNSGVVDFGNARFKGTSVRCDNALFAGAAVDFSKIQLESTPPELGDPQVFREGLRRPIALQSPHAD
ncbi:pentapeptide repeat-containing protein [Phytohabitans houttuyneae]|uniref:pentapeptide repeat-containing protein n=1 Tax=Phytohabitans houttuyneae TaxID=1076126 RepID=UPI00156730B1|nr:pentapeptide repeat-containing protein [Phytohabitans houttuyneae]